MKRRDWFVVGVKLFGVWLLYNCLEQIRVISEIYLGAFTPTRTPIALYWIYCGWYLLLGLYCLNGAPLLAMWAYGKPVEPHACGKCGYSLQGNVSGVCPECGAKITDDVQKNPL